MNAHVKASVATEPPSIPGLPLIGNSLKLIYDPQAYLLRLYHEYGPVYKIQMGFQRYTVMAGLEANKFLAKEGERVFSSERLFAGFARRMNTDVMLTVLDGAPHRHMRKVMQSGFSRSAAVPHLDTMIQIVKETTAAWKPGDLIRVFRTMRGIIVDQLGVITTGYRPSAYLDDILLYLNTLMNVEALKVYPRIMARRPAFKAAKERVWELGRKVLEFHRQNPPQTSGRTPDLIDDVLAAKRPDGEPFTEDDLISMSIGPFFAGMDTVSSSISFLVYTLLKYPDVLAMAQAEVDAAFAKEAITHKDFQQMPVLHAAILETLRLYPATPFTPRTVIQEFEFGGYTFKEGTEVMIAQTLTHFLPEYYPDPMKFDVNRHLEKSGPRVAQTYAPYTLGAHTCLGAGLAETQMIITMAALLHYAKFEFETPSYEAKIHTMPLPNPGQSFKIRINKVLAEFRSDQGDSR